MSTLGTQRTFGSSCFYVRCRSLCRRSSTNARFSIDCFRITPESEPGDDLREKFERELARKVAIREDGRVRKIPKIDLWVRRVIADAIKGDHRASRILIEMRSTSDDEIARGIAEQTIGELAAEDQGILDRHLAQLTTDAGTAEHGGAE